MAVPGALSVSCRLRKLRRRSDASAVVHAFGRGFWAEWLKPLHSPLRSLPARSALVTEGRLVVAICLQFNPLLILACLLYFNTSVHLHMSFESGKEQRTIHKQKVANDQGHKAQVAESRLSEVALCLRSTFLSWLALMFFCFHRPQLVFTWTSHVT